jgi:hypothetical protein
MLTVVTPHELHAGAHVVILEGPFAGCSAVVCNLDRPDGAVLVEFERDGEIARLECSPSQLRATCK